MSKNVLILGAGSDMASATAGKFAAEGYSILLAARKTARLRPLQSDLQIRYNIACSLHEFDALRFDEHYNFWSSIPVKPDVTVYFIGYMKENTTVVASLEETLKTINTNLTGAVSIFNIISAHYAKQNEGVLVGVSSVAGLRGRQSNFIYGAAKAGFTAYLSGLRNSMYHNNVHVVTVLPGFVNTKMTEDLTLPKFLIAQPEDVASALFNAVKNKTNTIYVKWFWKWIMLLIVLVPEPIFKRLKL